MATLTKELMEQREQSDACIDSAESRQKKAEGQLMERQNKAEGQLVEAGESPLDDDDLDQAAGGVMYVNPQKTNKPNAPL